MALYMDLIFMVKALLLLVRIIQAPVAWRDPPVLTASLMRAFGAYRACLVINWA